MSDRLSETATLYEFFSLLAAGKHDGNARDELAPVLEKMAALSWKENIMQPHGKDHSEDINPLSSQDWPLATSPNITSWQDKKEILIPSIATLPSFATDVHVKVKDISVKTSIKKMPDGPLTDDDAVSASKDRRSRFTFKKMIRELCDINDFKKMVKDLVQTSQSRYRPLREGMKHEKGRKRSNMAEECEREDRDGKRRRVDRQAM